MKKAIAFQIASLLSILFFLTGCVEKPGDITPVNNFKAEQYLGTWYEIARYDYAFERGLSQVTATYSLREDGGIKVVNRGYSAEKAEWKESTGKAYFVEGKDIGYLKVSFFGPFYSSYIVFELDENYQYALVTGSDKSYLWILSRTPTIPDNVKGSLLAKATALGFDVNKLIYVNQY